MGRRREESIAGGFYEIMRKDEIGFPGSSGRRLLSPGSTFAVLGEVALAHVGRSQVICEVVVDFI